MRALRAVALLPLCLVGLAAPAAAGSYVNANCWVIDPTPAECHVVVSPPPETGCVPSPRVLCPPPVTVVVGSDGVTVRVGELVDQHVPLGGPAAS